MTIEERKRFAAICYVLGWMRGQLGRVLDGTADLQRVREVFEASELSRIAAATGMTDADFPTDWHEYLTDAEQWVLGGRDDALH